MDISRNEKCRRIKNGGTVPLDHCWHCEADGVRLVLDPMVLDQIGICFSCSVRRQGIVQQRRTQRD